MEGGDGAVGVHEQVTIGESAFRKENFAVEAKGKFRHVVFTVAGLEGREARFKGVRAGA